MRTIKTILIAIFLITINIAYASSDRIERPKTYKFIFLHRDTVILNNPDDSILKAYSDSIVHHKKKLIEAELLFQTGERLTFKHNGNNWTVIRISDKKIKSLIPETTLKKISEIHFATVALLWRGSDRRAFQSRYFYVQFEMGKERFYNKYQELNLFFSSNKFSNSEVSKQISESTEQWTKF